MARRTDDGDTFAFRGEDDAQMSSADPADLSSMMVLVSRVMSKQLIRIRNLENELDTVRWQQREHGLKIQEELFRMKGSLAKRQLVSVLEQRVIALLIESARSQQVAISAGSYLDLEWLDMRRVFERYTQGNKEPGSHPTMDSKLAGIFKNILKELFGDDLNIATDKDVLDLLYDLSDDSKEAREYYGCECVRHDQTRPTEDELKERFESDPQYGKWFRALLQTKRKSSFAGRSLLDPLDKVDLKRYRS